VCVPKVNLELWFDLPKKISRRGRSRPFSTPSRNSGKPYKSSGAYHGSNKVAFLGYRGRGNYFRNQNQSSTKAMPTTAKLLKKDKA
jgi:hypothetical protein